MTVLADQDTDEQVDADIARLIARRRQRQQRGWDVWWTSNPNSSRIRTGPNPQQGRARPQCSPRTRPHQHPTTRLTPYELDALEHTVAFALAGLTIRQERAA